MIIHFLDKSSAWDINWHLGNNSFTTFLATHGVKKNLQDFGIRKDLLFSKIFITSLLNDPFLGPPSLILSGPVWNIWSRMKRAKAYIETAHHAEKIWPGQSLFQIENLLFGKHEWKMVGYYTGFLSPSTPTMMVSSTTAGKQLQSPNIHQKSPQSHTSSIR